MLIALFSCKDVWLCNCTLQGQSEKLNLCFQICAKVHSTELVWQF